MVCVKVQGCNVEKLGETVKMCVFEWLSYTNDQHGEKNKL